MSKYAHPGEKNGRHKLTTADVRELRALRRIGIPLVDIANEYGVSISAVWMAARGLTWRHVEAA